MSDTNKPSVLFWVVGGLFLVWNLFGCYLFYMDQTMTDAAYTEAYGQAMTDLRSAYPAWSMAAYGIAVGVGLLAAIMFLLKKKLAFPLFVISVIAAVISFIWGFITPEYKAAAGSAFWVMPVIVVLIGILESWVSKRKIGKGILN